MNAVGSAIESEQTPMEPAAGEAVERLDEDVAGSSAGSQIIPPKIKKKSTPGLHNGSQKDQTLKQIILRKFSQGEYRLRGCNEKQLFRAVLPEKKITLQRLKLTLNRLVMLGKLNKYYKKYYHPETELKRKERRGKTNLSDSKTGNSKNPRQTASGYMASTSSKRAS